MRNTFTLTVFSDSHGNVRGLERILPVINASTYCIFLGDGNRDIAKLEDKIAVPIVRVRGNCDCMPGLPSETVLRVGHTDFLITHGNAYGVKSSRIALTARARELGCAWALYGHTHKAEIADAGGVMLLNPGAASGKASYARIEGDGDTFFGEILPLI